MNRIIIGLILAVFCSCGKTTSQQRTREINAKCKSFAIDTISILTNKNLETLIPNLDATSLTTHTKVDEIPEFIKVFLDSLTGTDFLMANPGDEWQATDVVLDDLPDRQLVYFGLGQNIALLTYFKGGMGMSERILIFQFENYCMTDFWCGGVLTKLTTKDKILEYLKNNKDKKWGLNTNIIYL